MQTAVVTGASGFVGYHLIRELIAHDVTVWAVCRKNSKTRCRLEGLAHVSVVEWDWTQPETLLTQAIDAVPDVFFHLAWEGASGPLRADYPTQLRNVKAACDAAVAAKGLGCKKFVTTGTVYENLCDKILQETVFKTPAYYLLCKRHTHEMLIPLTARLGLDFVWCTFFHPLGQYMKAEQLGAYTIQSLVDRLSPSFGPAQQPFDIIAVEDLAHGLYLAGEKVLSQNAYYIGSGTPRYLHEYLRAMQELVEPSVALQVGTRPDDGLKFDFAWLDCSAFAESTGYRPQISFEEAVKRTAKWVREMKNGRYGYYH